MTKKRPKNPQVTARPGTISLLLLVAALAAFVLWQGGTQRDNGTSPEQTIAFGVTEALKPQAAPTSDVPEQVSNLPPVDYEDLPPEAHDTIALIDQGGPFPYSKDGSTFQNREGLLPGRSVGYYAEYTVITPGSPDRGARRIVAGEAGEMYYTNDHYASFQEVIR